MSSDPDSRPLTPLPEAGQDPGEPDQMNVYHDPSAAPIGNPTLDMDMSDDESVLSEVDEAQFENFDPANVAIDDRPAIAVDEDNVKLIGRHKRQRDGDEEGKKKKKEGKREKVKKPRKKRDDSDVDFSGGEELEGKRKRKIKPITEGVPRQKKEKPRARQPSPENEQELSPEESMLPPIIDKYSEYGVKTDTLL